jgi:hypothetical protein
MNTSSLILVACIIAPLVVLAGTLMMKIAQRFRSGCCGSIKGECPVPGTIRLVLEFNRTAELKEAIVELNRSGGLFHGDIVFTDQNGEIGRLHLPKRREYLPIKPFLNGLLYRSPSSFVIPLRQSSTSQSMDCDVTLNPNVTDQWLTGALHASATVTISVSAYGKTAANCIS